MLTHRSASLILFATLLTGFSALRPVRGQDVETRVDVLLGQLSLDEKLTLLGGDKDGFSTFAVPRLHIPKLVMADGPQGVRNYGPACLFPAGAALAATWDESLATVYGRGIGLEARARGVHIMLGPGVNISRVPVNGRNFEYFGEDPFLASQVAVNWVRGIQAEGVAATIKHYAGNNQETKRNDVDVDMDDRTLHEIYLPTFRRAVAEGRVQAVMCAYNRFRGDHCGGSDFLLNKVLKGELAFAGLIMSDWGACHAVTDLARGLDLEMPHARYLNADKIKESLGKNEVTPERVDDAVRRLLRIAATMGFLDREQKRPELPLDSPASSKTALEIARAAVVLLKNESGCLPLDRQRLRRIAVYGPNSVQSATGGGGSGGVTPFHTVSYLEGIRAAAGCGVEVVSVPDEELTPEEAAHFPMVRTAPDGPMGFSVKATPKSPDAPAVDLPVQSGIDMRWKAGELPFGLPGGSVDVDFSGVLMAEESGDWEVRANGRTSVEIDGQQRFLGAGDVVHLEKGRPIPIRLAFRRIEREHPKDKPREFHTWLSLRKPRLPDLAASRGADAVVLCMGFRNSLESEGFDRPFDLPEMQRRLIAAASACNPRTVVINNSGAGVGVADWIGKVRGVLQAWYLGQEGGTAIGEILFGDVNPSGRLPDTFDRTFSDNPAVGNYPGELDDPAKKWIVEHYREGIFVGYRGYDKQGKTPLFPFGYGLSYTTFDYSDLRVTMSGDDSAHATLKVKNTGARGGVETVQLYIGQPTCPVERPVRELKAFAKVALQPGESREVSLELPRESFAFWHPDKHVWAIDPAAFVIEAGHSSRELPLRVDFNLGGEKP